MRSTKWTWKNVDFPKDDAQRLALEFEAAVIDAGLAPVEWDKAESHHVELLAHLGDVYSRLGRLEKGLEVDQTLVRIRPQEPIFHYNLACSHSRLGNIEPALEALRIAVHLGYDNFEHLRTDEDLDNLKRDGRFHELLKQFEPS